MGHGEPDLFGVGRKAKQKKSAPLGMTHALQRLFGVYRELYEHRVQEPPVILKQHGAFLKTLITKYGAEKVEQRLRLFLTSEDRFIVDSGFALDVFYRQWNRLAVQAQNQAPRSSIPDADRTADYMKRMSNS